MDQAEEPQHFDDESSFSSKEQSPSLLTVILDTNPAAWAVLQDTLSLSQTVANILVFINAHLACNYTNQVAVIASHCDRATWLYPTADHQHAGDQRNSISRRSRIRDGDHQANGRGTPRERARIPGSVNGHQNETSSKDSHSNTKYRPFRLIEDELLSNLTTLLASTNPLVLQQGSTSTMIAGALTLALNYINRATIEYNESISGAPSNNADHTTTAASTNPDTGNNPLTNALQARILLVTLSPSTDLAHQYIPIMNSIFACQRLGIPIDVLHLPLPTAQDQNVTTATTHSSNQNSNVFLQQAADATHGIFIPAHLNLSAQNPTSTETQKIASSALLTYLLTAFLPTPQTRTHLILPTRIDVDFRAACFCHRNVISIGFVCSICLSIFCQESADLLASEGCLTCGTKLSLGEGVMGAGSGPVVVARRGRRRRRGDGR